MASVPDALSFSIVIPTYQGRNKVCETLRAICALTWTGIVEVIAVVDGSTDGSATALRQIQCRFPVHIVEQPNCGQAAARNRGAAEAIGTILLFLDDDMICRPDLLDIHAESFRRGADAVIGGFVETGSHIAGLTSRDDVIRTFRPPSGSLSTFDIYGGHLAVRRTVFQELGGFDASFTPGGDYGCCDDSDFGRRLLQRYAVVGNPEAICGHEKRISPMEYLRRARQAARSEARLLRKHPDLRDDLIRWSGAARRSKRLRLLSRVPFVPQFVAGCVGIGAAAAVRTPLRASKNLERLCAAAYAWNYWATVYREGVLPELWGRDAVC